LQNSGSICLVWCMEENKCFFLGTCERKVMFSVIPYREGPTSLDFYGMNSFGISPLPFCRVRVYVSPIAFSFLKRYAKIKQLSVDMFVCSFYSAKWRMSCVGLVFFCLLL
jgi:hypothetical protein